MVDGFSCASQLFLVRGKVRFPRELDLWKVHDKLVAGGVYADYQDFSKVYQLVVHWNGLKLMVFSSGSGLFCVAPEKQGVVDKMLDEFYQQYLKECELK